MDMIESLMKLQLTRQEATIYAILVNEGAMTGYEVSKISGISRSNTYSALAGLVEKGAAYITEGTSTRYIPVDAGELCDNRIFEIHKIKNFLITNLKPRSDDSEGYITIKGEKHILNKMRNILKNARERAYISVSHKILHEINDELINAVERKIKLVIITNPPFAFPGAIIYLTEKQPEQIRLIADSSVVLTGDIEDSVHSTCLYSKKKNLVDLFKESIKNEIKLIEQSKI
ncbi:MAG: TrmB family transcriptional regulator [Clostridiaceae bacterium]|jgi:sugar-specific transcriptional regulator TrmB|nr:TrmB family transcriptional regulator [Clostridiaceae bacterium]